MKRIRIYRDETLVYKQKEMRGLRKNVIADMYADTIAFTNGDRIALNEIRLILPGRSSPLTRLLYKVPMQAGIFLTCIDAFNNTINYEPTIVNPRVGKVAAGMFITGVIIKVLSTRRVRPGRNKRLRIFDLNFY